MENFKKNFKYNLIVMLISLAVSLGLIALYVFVWKGFTIAYLSDGFFAMGGVMFFAALLMLVAKLGFFNFASYGFRQFGSIMFVKKEDRKLVPYDEYCQIKQEKRKNSKDSFVCFLILGLIYIIISIIITLSLPK